MLFAGWLADGGSRITGHTSANAAPGVGQGSCCVVVASGVLPPSGGPDHRRAHRVNHPTRAWITLWTAYGQVTKPSAGRGQPYDGERYLLFLFGGGQGWRLTGPAASACPGQSVGRSGARAGAAPWVLLPVAACLADRLPELTSAQHRTVAHPGGGAGGCCVGIPH